ncbi:MAG: hypothetical protein A3F11_11315 [Gammaproteobacteria bacterium RIFCSPHIGHO2_12_FULL_37_14]|nr:MAG: hypothetical protein A3F11_11315 [Gammaproteobacteria bacterium RIFCSPHIGHO2_12_FULL_37_14]
MTKRKYHLYLYIFIGVVILFLIIRVLLSGDKHPHHVAAVSVSPVVKKDVMISMQTIGTVQAYSSVDVRSMVTGQIISEGFKEGDMVSNNQELFLIDQRPFIAAFNQAKADLLRNQAIVADFELQVKRNTSLLKKGYVAAQVYDSLVANHKSAAAAVQAAEAAVENATLQLSYTTIRAPIAGKTGNVVYQTGTIIKANDALLVTINQINPIYVVFSLPQNRLFSILERYNSKQSIPVKVTIRDKEIETGEVTFIDNTINTATGTVQLKATFANKQNKLWPGQYVNIELPVEDVKQALLIPSLAVLTGQNGFYVYVVDDKSMVQVREVTPGDTVHGQIIIIKGLHFGEKVIISGQLKLKHGMKVKTVE